MTTLGMSGPIGIITIFSSYALLTLYSIIHLFRNKKFQGLEHALIMLFILALPILGSSIYLYSQKNNIQ